MNPTDEARALPRGLELRTADEADVEGIVALETAAFGASDEPGVRAHLTGPGADPADWAVVTDRDRVVSASACLPITMVLDGMPFPAAQIEYVATDPAHQRRGLTRALMDRHHQRSAAVGHLAQFIGGIPYLYRRFGYGYGVDYPTLFLVDRGRLEPDARITVRPAAPADLPDLHALDATRPAIGLRVRRDDDHWLRWMTMAAHRTPDAPAAERFVVAERAGRVVGWVSLSRDADSGRVYFSPCVTADASVTDTLLAHTLDAAAGDLVIAHDTPGTEHGRRLHQVGSPVPFGLGLYVRIADPIALLDHLRPVLSARLAASDLADRSGEVEISLYQRGLAIAYADGAVTGIRSVPAVEDPFDDGECGVAPDWFPALVFGRWGATELARRTDDVTLGRHGRLLETLFPRRAADLVGDF